ncbi:MAG: hypothetical protein ABIV21_03515 [Pyrinomonadaceae bacterium]
MRLISEQKAIERLRALKDDLKARIASGYEQRAKDCLTCETQGACCLDAHFVNVRISKLDSVAIRRVLDGLEPQHRESVYERISSTVERFGLTDEGAESYACPLFERGTGCLAHNDAKPAPCITHACYERAEDLPPDRILATAEQAIDSLNKQAYGMARPGLPIPLAILTRG